jgi:hypothetical protein
VIFRGKRIWAAETVISWLIFHVLYGSVPKSYIFIAAYNYIFISLAWKLHIAGNHLLGLMLFQSFTKCRLALHAQFFQTFISELISTEAKLSLANLGCLKVLCGDIAAP